MCGIYPLALNNYPGHRHYPALYPYRATITAFLGKFGTTLKLETVKGEYIDNLRNNCLSQD